MKTSSQAQDNDLYILQGKRRKKKFYRKPWFIISAAVLLCAVVIVTVLMLHRHTGNDVNDGYDGDNKMQVSVKQESMGQIDKYATFSNVKFNGVELRIFCVPNGQADLHVGSVDIEDTTIIMAIRAADVRADNGEIAGAFVHNGTLLSQGKAKKGFCAIINGKVIIGGGENSSYFEEAINNGGDFFRQFPLVVDGMAIENKPKGTSMRRALCEKDGQIMVIESSNISFHDFAQVLSDYGVANAIYLTGGTAFGFYRTKDDKRHDLGDSGRNNGENLSYIIWK